MLNIEIDKIKVCLNGSQISLFRGHTNIELSAFMLNVERVVPSEDFFVFYGTQISIEKTKSNDGSLEYVETKRVKYITVDLSLVDDCVKEIVFVGALPPNEKRSKEGSYTKLKNSYLSVVEVETKNELLRCDGEKLEKGATAIEYGRLFKKEENWIFEVLGTSNKEKLDFFVTKYYKGEYQWRKPYQ